jgi:hypothetical protein
MYEQCKRMKEPTRIAFQQWLKFHTWKVEPPATVAVRCYHMETRREVTAAEDNGGEPPPGGTPPQIRSERREGPFQRRCPLRCLRKLPA